PMAPAQAAGSRYQQTSPQPLQASCRRAAWLCSKMIHAGRSGLSNARKGPRERAVWALRAVRQLTGVMQAWSRWGLARFRLGPHALVRYVVVPRLLSCDG